MREMRSRIIHSPVHLEKMNVFRRRLIGVMSITCFLCFFSLNAVNFSQEGQLDMALKSRINFSQQMLLHEQCHQGVQLKIVQALSPFFQLKKYIAIVDPATHANVGNSMIVQGEIALVRRMGHQVSYMCGFAQDGQEWLQECEFQKFFYSRDRDVVMSGSTHI
jgi:hypothetical protein